ncbi:MAG TPA: tetratricopeptide repeat protein [Patescibacteria group bacterium]|jgi:tetratricopeptide (TPR) repeat protein|nr:tetratricopeptide repeat protein [Patescibacteria group bacterium]
MSTTADQQAFLKGMIALSEGRHEDAVALFQSALQLESQRGAAGRQMRYLSYYGLSSALANRPTPEAIQACELAARRDFCSAELQLNLGKVYMMAGKTTRALAALERGLKISPGSKSLQDEKARADRRKRPAIPWLRRNHPVNCWLGRVRSTLGTRARSAS